MQGPTTVPVAPNRVRAFVALRGITMDRLAEMAGLPRSALAKALRLRCGSMDLLTALAVALDVPAAALAGGCPHDPVLPANEAQRKPVR